jgi:single-strand DNA-binding protein
MTKLVSEMISTEYMDKRNTKTRKTDKNNKNTGGQGMNQVVLMGRLTKDPELRYTAGNNTAVCGFTLAVDKEFQKEGEEKQADFFPCVVWEKKGEAASKYLSKGRRIGVVGRLQNRSWEDTEGKKHYITEVVVGNWYFADDKKKEDGQAAPQNQQQTSPAQNQNQNSNPPKQQGTSQGGGQQQGQQSAGKMPWEQ